MSKVTFQKLCEELAPFIERRDTNYRKAISLRKRVAKSTVCQIVLEVCTCIVEVLFKRLVHLPVTQQDIETKVAAFFECTRFPQVVSAIDGCHIAILAPNENPEGYVNRKVFYSIILQRLVDSKYLFRDVYVGLAWEGS